jgi:hypothetical protein
MLPLFFEMPQASRQPQQIKIKVSSLPHSIDNIFVSSFAPKMY